MQTILRELHMLLNIEKINKYTLSPLSVLDVQTITYERVHVPNSNIILLGFNVSNTMYEYINVFCIPGFDCILVYHNFTRSHNFIKHSISQKLCPCQSGTDVLLRDSNNIHWWLWVRYKRETFRRIKQFKHAYVPTSVLIFI